MKSVLLFIVISIGLFSKLSFASVTKAQFSKSLRSGITEVIKKRSLSEDIDHSNSQETTSKINRIADEWAKIINLMPANSLTDEQATWIKSSILLFNTRYGLSAIDKSSESHTYVEKVLANSKKQFSTLTEERLANLVDERSHHLRATNEFYVAWFNYVCNTLSTAKLIKMRNSRLIFRGTVEGLVQITTRKSEVKDDNEGINFSKQELPSSILSSMLAYYTYQFLNEAYLLNYSGSADFLSIEYLPEPVLKDIFPINSFSFKSFLKLKGSLEKELNRSYVMHDDTFLMDGVQFHHSLWDGFQLQLGDLNQKQSNDKSLDKTKGNYVVFKNNTSIWKNLANKKLKLLDPSIVDLSKIEPTQNNKHS